LVEFEMRFITKKLYFIFGFTFFIIGLLGYYLPILPGTIFMIISAYFFMHSSDHFYNKIVNNPYYGKPIKSYIEDNVISFKSKLVILLSMWAATIISILLIPFEGTLFNISLFSFNLPINIFFISILLSLIGTFFVLKTKDN
tara:strand:+ start:428 stop:853 length:426 start_codon:yes stop_codon:yes gene_type:complete